MRQQSFPIVLAMTLMLATPWPCGAQAPDAKSADEKPADAKATDAKPPDAKPADAKATDAKPVKPVSEKANDLNSDEKKEDVTKIQVNQEKKSIGKRSSSPNPPPPPEFYFIDKSGKQVMPFNFHQAISFKEGLAPVLIADQWGYINPEGTVVIGANFDLAGNFTEGLAPVKVNDKWGYIDNTGKTVIEPRFAAADSFKNGYAIVQLSKESPEFPKAAQERLQNILKDPSLSPMKKAVLAIANTRTTGIIDRKGKFVVQPLYTSALNFDDNLALTKLDGKIAYVDKKGEVVLTPECQDARSFSEGLAGVKVKDKWGYINSKGSFVIKPTFDEVDDFHKGLAGARLAEKGWGFVDKKGKWAIEPKYNTVWEGFSTGVAVVCKDMCQIENTHADITRLGSGFSVTRKKGSQSDFDESTTPLEPGYFAYPDYRFFLIDKEGKELNAKGFELLGPLSDGLRAAKIDGRSGFVDNNGNIIIKPTYKFAESFVDGLSLVKDGTTRPRLIERNENLLRHPVPSAVTDPDLLKKDIAVCSEVIKRDPNNAQAYRDRGYFLCCLSRFNESLADFDEVTRLCPTSSEGYYWRGLANLQLSRYAEAAIDFTCAIEVEPNKPQNMWGRARALVELKKPELGLLDINKAILTSDHPYYRKLRGEILEEMGESKLALNELMLGRRAPILDPWPLGPKTQDDIQGHIDRLEKKYAASKNEKDKLKIAFLGSELADYLDDMRRLKLKEEKLLELEDLYKRAVALRREALNLAQAGTDNGGVIILMKNDLSTSIAQYAGWCVKTQQYFKAERLYGEALKLSGEIRAAVKQAELLTEMGKMYAAQENYEKALDFYKQTLSVTRLIIEKDPANAITKILQGQTLAANALVLSKMKKESEATENANEAGDLLKIGLDMISLPSAPPLPDNANGQESYELALQCKSLGLIETSRSYMQKAASRAASDRKTKDRAERFLEVYIPKKAIDLKVTRTYQRAHATESAGDYHAAEALYRDCINNAPDFEWPYEALARIKRQEGNLEEAETLIKKALAINPGYLEGWVELGRISKAQGDLTKAKEAMDKALKLDPESQLAQFEQTHLSTD